MPDMNHNRAVVLFSGGLDSTTLLYDFMEKGQEVHALSFDYGQRHRKEVEVARRLSDRLGIRHDTINLGVVTPYDVSPLASILGDTSLVSDTPVPDGHYADENMKATVVPNRNAIMLSIAYGIALADNAHTVSFAAHSGDHAIYPDCRPEFVQELNKALRTGNRWDDSTLVPVIRAPFLEMTKGDIAVRAHQIGVPIENTWSCYKGGEVHCGTCGTCYERREALAQAATINPIAWQDPTTYLDSTTVYADPSRG